MVAFGSYWVADSGSRLRMGLNRARAQVFFLIVAEKSNKVLKQHGNMEFASFEAADKCREHLAKTGL